MSGKRLIVKNTLMLYVRQIFTLAIALYTSRLALKLLGISDLGVYSAVGGITAILSVLTASMSSSTQRFMTFSLGNGELRKIASVFRSSMQIHLLVSILFLLFAESLGIWFLYEKMTIPPERLTVAFWVFQCTILNCVLGFLNVPYSAAVIAHEDMGFFAVTAVCQSALLCLLVWLLHFVSWDKLLWYAILHVFVFSLVRQTTVIFCKNKYPEVRIPSYSEIDISLLKEMSGMAGWVVLSNIAIAGFTQGINLLFNVFFGPLLNAAYTVAMQAYSGIRSFTSNFQLASNPQIVKTYSSGNLEELQNLLFLVCKISFFLVFWLSLPFVLYRDAVLLLWLGEVPAHAANFFLLLFVYAYVDVIAYPMNIAAQATGRLRGYTLTSSVILLSSLPIGYILMRLGLAPEYVYVGCIVVATIGVAARIYMLAFLIHLKISKFIFNVIVPSIGVMLMSCAIALSLKSAFCGGVVMTILNFMCDFLITGLIICFVGVSKEERRQLLIMFKSKLLNLVGFH